MEWLWETEMIPGSEGARILYFSFLCAKSIVHKICSPWGFPFPSICVSCLPFPSNVPLWCPCMVAFLNRVPFGTDIADLARLSRYKDLEIPMKIPAAAHNVTISERRQWIRCPDDSLVTVSAGIYRVCGADRRWAAVAILQFPSIRRGLFRARDAHGRKGDDFSDASDGGEFADDGAEQRQAGADDAEGRFHHGPVQGRGEEIFSINGLAKTPLRSGLRTVIHVKSSSPELDSYGWRRSVAFGFWQGDGRKTYRLRSYRKTPAS